MITDQLSIDTPENVVFNFEVAGVGSRFVALFIDSIIQGLVILIFAIAVSAAGDLLKNLFADLPNWVIAMLIFGVFLVYSLYFIIFELLMHGQTPGKRLVGLRVMREDGRPLDIAALLIRNLVRLIDFFPFGYSLGFVVMLFSARAKRLGDLAAGTLVIKERKLGKHNDITHAIQNLAVSPSPAPTSTEIDDTDDVFTQIARKLSEPEVQMIESLLQRRYQLNNANALAEKIADGIAAKANTPELEQAIGHLSDFDFLKGLAQAYRNRQKSVL